MRSMQNLEVDCVNPTTTTASSSPQYMNYAESNAKDGYVA